VQPGVGTTALGQAVRCAEAVEMLAKACDVLLQCPVGGEHRRRAGDRGPVVTHVTQVVEGEAKQRGMQPRRMRAGRRTDERPAGATAFGLYEAHAAQRGEGVASGDDRDAELGGQAALGRQALTVEQQELAAGGTAVGTGLNAPEGFGEQIAAKLSELTGLPLNTAPNKFAAQGSLDGMVAVSAGLRGVAVALMKIANDMRWLASGPRAGLHELKLPSNEPGSSIMPGKVNPTQQEAMVMVCLQVIGEDSIVAAAGAQGNFELNAMRPIIINNVLHSARILGDMCEKLREFSVEGTELDQAKVSDYVGRSLALVTALSPTIGYDKASAISHKADDEGTSLREAALALGVSAADFDRIVRPETMVGNPRRDLGVEHAGNGQR
jgi:Lyase/Fumarase C C-terminus